MSSEISSTNPMLKRTWTLKEKVAQLFIVGIQDSVEELEPFFETGLGGLILFRKDFQHFDSAFEARRAIMELRQHFKGGELSFISVDQEGGQIERLPQWIVPSGVNASSLGLQNNIDLTEQIALETAHRLKWLGINLNYTPVLDLNLEPNNPIIAQRAFHQNNTQLIVQHSKAVFEAYLSAGLLPVAKHFPGHGSGAVDSHLSLPRFLNWQATELEPYQQLIQQNLPAILVAHGLYPELSQRLEGDPEIPSTISGAIIQKLLRTQLGFRGLVLSDDLKMGAALEIAEDPESLAVKAFQAGIEMMIWQFSLPEAQIAYNALVKRFSQNKLPEEQLDEILLKILQTKAFLQSKPVMNYPDKALSPEACHTQSKLWAQKAAFVSHHHVPSCLPLNQYSEWALITPDLTQSVHYQPDIGMPNHQSPEAWAKAYGLNPVALYQYPLKYQANNLETILAEAPTWTDRTLDAIVFVAYNSQLSPLQQAYYHKLQQTHPKTKIILASGSYCIDMDILPSSWAHIALPQLRSSGWEVLMQWLCEKPLKL